MKIRWLKRATESLIGIHNHIAAENAEAAKHSAHRIHSATKRLAMFPHSGRLGEVSGTRELVVSGTPYIVTYRVMSEEVQILRVFHDAQQRQIIP
jgi:toxin ParE1/3/4